jgi:hypothetical protein
MTFAAAIRRTVDRFVGGRGKFSITVPVMDGALKPNDLLEDTAGVATIAEADNAVVVANRLIVSSGHRIVEVDATGRQREHSRHEAPISCLAVSASGAIAIGLDGIGLKIAGGNHDGRLFDRLSGGPLNCPTAAMFLDEDTLIACNGSASFPAAQWSHDLLHLGHTGTVARIDLTARTPPLDLAAGLCFPAGICANGASRDVVVSEAWRHRLIALAPDRPSFPAEILGGLPGYPGRLHGSAAGGSWLALFAVRSQLQEFVLRESRFRKQMIAEIDPEFWIAPALASGRSFKEPLQAGGVIRLGIHKPWAPTRSYGLVVRLDADFQPVWSAHSRAGATRHGITSLVESGGRLVATSKGKGEVVAFDHTGLSEPLNTALHEELAR